MRVVAYVLVTAGCAREPAPKLNDDVKVEKTAAPSAMAVTSTVAPAPGELSDPGMPPRCILSDRYWREVTLWPTAAGLGAYQRALSSDASQVVWLRLRYENRAFHVAHGTRCEVLDESALGARVRVLDGPSKGKIGWVRHDWHVGK